FNGWPASFKDIESGLTFERDLVESSVNSIINENRIFCVVVGASGVGKTTAARQVLLNLSSKGYQSWEHKADLNLDVPAWLTVAKGLKGLGKKACLMIDEAHNHEIGR
ncbi:hypothetical protein ALQ14_05347, partial [Pseudomonas savastanoi pv. glycinea]|uniref:ATP-binding protein n=1 Tax=Pseudomonas savastanoi TaxID=29438 RepID=UPI000F3F1D48